MVKLHYLISANDSNRSGTISCRNFEALQLQVISMFLDFKDADEFIVTGSPDGLSIDVKINLNVPEVYFEKFEND
nr:MAG: hypothetical protein [Microvirus sp.]